MRPVAEFFLDGQGLAVPVFGLVQLAPVLGGDAELVVNGRYAGPVVEFFEDGQGPAVPVFSLLQPPPDVGGHAELVVVAGQQVAPPEFFADLDGPAVPLIALKLLSARDTRPQYEMDLRALLSAAGPGDLA